MSPAHGHFNGSANCIECGGRCKLTGAERALTEMVRWRLEPQARDWSRLKARRPRLNLMERQTLADIGADPDELIWRSMEEAPPP